MPEFPGNPNLRQLLAVHSTRNGVPLEDRQKDGTAPPTEGSDSTPPVEEPPVDVSRETPEEPPPQAARRRR